MTEHHDYETSFVIDDALSVIVLVQRLPSDSVAAKELQAAVDPRAGGSVPTGSSGRRPRNEEASSG